MSSALRNGVIVAGILLAGGAYLGLRHAQHQPTSPVVAESATEKLDHVQAAFSGDAEANDAEIEGFVARLQAAVKAGDRARMVAMVDPGRMLDGVEAATGRSLPPLLRTGLEAQLGSALLDTFDATVVETTVKRIDRDAQGNIVVYLRTIDRDRITMKARWWLYPAADGLRWWDGEDLQTGLRISTVMAAGIAASSSQSGSAAIERLLAVITRLAETDMGDPAQMQAIAAELDGLPLGSLPPSFRHLAIAARASLALGLGDPTETLRQLDTLESEPLEPLDVPMRHFLRASALLQLQRHAEAAQAATTYLEQLGDDAEAFHMLGLAELGRDDRSAALAAFDRGLADDPRLPEDYAGVAMASEDLAVVAERLRRAPDDEVLEGAAQWLLEAEEGEALGRLLTAAGQARPGWDTVTWRGRAELLVARAADPSAEP